MSKMSTTRDGVKNKAEEVSSDDDSLPCCFVDLTRTNPEEYTSVTDRSIGQSPVDLTVTNSEKHYAARVMNTDRSPEKKQYQ